MNKVERKAIQKFLTWMFEDKQYVIARWLQSGKTITEPPDYPDAETLAGHFSSIRLSGQYSLPEDEAEAWIERYEDESLAGAFQQFHEDMVDELVDKEQGRTRIENVGEGVEDGA